MIKRQIICENTDCENSFTEEHENQGFHGWGEIRGYHGIDKNGMALTLTLCPDCMKEVMQWLHGQT